MAVNWKKTKTNTTKSSNTNILLCGSHALPRVPTVLPKPNSPTFPVNHNIPWHIQPHISVTKTHNNLQQQHRLSRHANFAISNDFLPGFLTPVSSTYFTYCLKFCKMLILVQFLAHFYRAMLRIRGTSHGHVSVCLSVSVSVTSRCSTKKRQNVGSHRQHHTIPQGL